MFLKEHLSLCFNSIDWDAKCVQKCQTTVANARLTQAAQTDAQDFLSDWLLNLNMVMAMQSAITNDIRGGINTIFLKTQGRDSRSVHFGCDVSKWTDEYQMYTQERVAFLQSTVVKMESEEQSSMASADMKKAWANCASKVKLVLQTRSEASLEIGELMPFMTASIWKTLSKHLQCIPSVLNEVCVVSFLCHNITALSTCGDAHSHPVTAIRHQRLIAAKCNVSCLHAVPIRRYPHGTAH